MKKMGSDGKQNTLTHNTKENNMTYTKEEQVVWDDFFCTLVGWTLHPGYSADYYRKNAAAPDLEECADRATLMMEIRRKRIESSNNSDK